VLRVVVTLNLGTVSKAQNVYHLMHVTGSAQDDDDVLDAVEEWVDDLYDKVQTATTTDVVMDKVEVYEWLMSQWGPIGVRTPTWAGSAAVERVASGVCMLINAFKERSGHSDKKYLAGLAEARLATDSWDSTGLSSGNAFAAFWIADFTAANGVQFEPIYFKASTGQTAGYVSKSVNTLAAYQRRRKPGVGLT